MNDAWYQFLVSKIKKKPNTEMLACVRGLGARPRVPGVTVVCAEAASMRLGMPAWEAAKLFGPCIRLLLVLTLCVKGSRILWIGERGLDPGQTLRVFREDGVDDIGFSGMTVVRVLGFSSMTGLRASGFPG